MFKQYFPELGTDLVLFGKTKILMRSPAINIIEGGYKEKVTYFINYQFFIFLVFLLF